MRIYICKKSKVVSTTYCDYLKEEAFRSCYADCDLRLRIYQRGYELIESPDSYIEHYAHANARQRNENALNYIKTKKHFLRDGLLANKMNIENILSIKAYDDRFNTAKAFKKIRPIEINRIKGYLKEQIKKRIPNI